MRSFSSGLANQGSTLFRDSLRTRRQPTARPVIKTGWLSRRQLACHEDECKRLERHEEQLLEHGGLDNERRLHDAHSTEHTKENEQLEEGGGGALRVGEDDREA